MTGKYKVVNTHHKHYSVKLKIPKQQTSDHEPTETLAARTVRRSSCSEATTHRLTALAHLMLREERDHVTSLAACFSGVIPSIQSWNKEETEKTESLLAPGLLPR
jgi:hypothetical protein